MENSEAAEQALASIVLEHVSAVEAQVDALEAGLHQLVSLAAEELEAGRERASQGRWGVERQRCGQAWSSSQQEGVCGCVEGGSDEDETAGLSLEEEMVAVMEMRARRTERSAADTRPPSSGQPVVPTPVAPPRAPPADARAASRGDGGGHGRGQGQALGNLEVGSAYSQDGLSTDDELDTRVSTVGPWLLRNIPFNWLRLEEEGGGGRSGSDSKRKGAGRERGGYGGKGAETGAGARSQGGTHETSVVACAVTHACSNFSTPSPASTSLPFVSPCSSPTLSIPGFGCLTDDEALQVFAASGTAPRAPPREWMF